LKGLKGEIGGEYFDVVFSKAERMTKEREKIE